MSDIKLVSEEYTSRFVTGPELQTELSKKQDDVGLIVDHQQNVVQVGLRGFSQIGSNESNYFDGPVKFSSPIYDKNDNEITGGGSKWVVDESGLGQTWVTLGKDKYGTTVNSVFVSGPLYDKDGKEIKGGASTGGSKWIHDDYDTLMGETVNIGPGATYPENARLIYIEWPADGLLMFRCGQTDLQLDRAKLQKLKEWLES